MAIKQPAARDFSCPSPRAPHALLDPLICAAGDERAAGEANCAGIAGSLTFLESRCGRAALFCPPEFLRRLRAPCVRRSCCAGSFRRERPRGRGGDEEFRGFVAFGGLMNSGRESSVGCSLYAVIVACRRVSSDFIIVAGV